MKKKVLVVEDSRDMQAALADLFHAVQGFEVEFVTGETQATAWLEEHHDWTLAVLDLVLDEGSGFNLVRRFRRQNPNGRIVVLSAFVSRVIVETCCDTGADAVFHKDEADRFAAWLEQLVAGLQSAEPAANASQYADTQQTTGI